MFLEKIYMTKAITIIFTVTVLLFIFYPRFVIAQDSTPSALLKVKHIANLIERQKEKITLFLKFTTNDKLKYYKYLSEKRLAEIVYATENEYGDRIEETSARYLANIGNLTKYVESNNISPYKQELIDLSINHISVLENLRDLFPANSGWWLSIQHDINVIKMFSKQVSEKK